MIRLANSHRCCKHIWHLFSWYAWTTNIWGFLHNKDTFCVFFSLFQVWNDSHILCCLEGRTNSRSIDHHAPDLCVLSLTSDLRIVRWQRLLLPSQPWEIQAFPCRDCEVLALLVCHHNLEASSLSIGLYGAVMVMCATKHNTYTLLHTLVVAFPLSNH